MNEPHRIPELIAGTYSPSFEEAERQHSAQYLNAEAAARIVERNVVGGGLGEPLLL